MPASWRSVGLSFVLITGLLVVVAVGLSALGGLVLLPQLGAMGWVAVGVALFLGLQLVLFRLFGLRSRADDKPAEDHGAESPPDDEEPDDGQEGDWRAWRG